MQIKRSLSLALLVLAAVASSSLAKADTFGSYVGSTPPAGFNNGPVTYSNSGGSGNVTNYDYPGPFTPIAGTTYVSFGHGNQNPGLTTYTTSETANLAGDTGTVLVQADDFTSVSLNGFLLGTTPTGAFNTVTSFSILPGEYLNGLNTFSFVVNNTSGYTGVDFQATANAAPTPEPSSFLLLGTGILGLAGAVRRRLSV